MSPSVRLDLFGKRMLIDDIFHEAATPQRPAVVWLP